MWLNSEHTCSKLYFCYNLHYENNAAYVNFYGNPLSGGPKLTRPSDSDPNLTLTLIVAT